jgi:PKD repeat protein
MRPKLFSIFFILLFLCVTFSQSSASTVYFLVGELPGLPPRYESYVIPLSDPADIAHARDLITYGPGVGNAIVAAKIAKGANGINRNYLDPYHTPWSWHVSDFLDFYDMAMEICDGGPSFVENDLDYWVDTVGQICFWRFTIVAELGDLSVPRDLTVVDDGNGEGTVTSSPAGIDCGADCTEVYDDWTEITLTAIPEEGSVFDGWSGGTCSGTGDCTFRMASDIFVTATFSALPPLADFSGLPRSGNAPMIVHFTDLSSGTPTSWLWDFGDGKTGTKQNPTHVYENVGTYSVSLTAANGAGLDTLSKPDYITTGSCGNPPVRVGTFYYSTLQDAYDSPLTSTGDIIEGQAITFLGDVALWRDIVMTFAGGNNCEYADQAMGTTINGSLTVSSGTVIAKNLIVK